MSSPTRTTLLAATSVLLTSAALAPVYEDAAWLPPVAGGVLAVAAGGLLSRRLRVPVLLQPAVAALLVGAYVFLTYARDTLGLLLPTAETASRVGTLIGEGLLGVESSSPPVPTTPGLVLLAVLGVAGIAMLVDLLAAALRRPALAGLPLLALLVVPSGTVAGGVGWWPFTLGAAGWLLLLMEDAGTRVARWGTTVRRSSGRAPFVDSGLGRVGRRIGVAALGVAVVVPALVPGLEARLLTGGTGPGLGGSRTTVTYNPLTELGGQLRLPEPRPLLAYRTTDPAPDYLRLTTLDRFDDASGWSSSELSADVRRDAVSRGIPVPSAVRSAPTQQVTTAIRVQDLGGPWLPAPPVAATVDVAGPWLWDRASETVFSTRVDVRDVSEVYRVTANRVVPDPSRLRRGQRVPADIEAFAVPPEVSPYVRELTEQVVAGADTAYDRVAALQAFFRTPGNGFVYSEDTSVPGIDAPNALEAFLRGRQGFCEQYASAMAAMARVLGLPARVAVGFTPGERQEDGTYRVTTNDAHAWPEVWFSGAGWVRFEPTPRAEQVTTPDYTVPSAEGEAAGEQPSPSAGDLAQAPAPDVDDPSAQDPRLLEEDGAAAGQDSGPLTPARLLVAAAVLALLVAPALLAALRRRALWRSPGPSAAWTHVVEDATDVGHTWRGADSPLSAAQRLLAERPLAAGPAAALLRVAEQVEQDRYARPEDVGPVAVPRLRRDVALVRAGLLESAPARARWTARLLPASALRWAASATGGAVADLLDRVDELATAAGSRLRRGARPAA